jgi:uncharacterized protein (DUF1697 family)
MPAYVAMLRGINVTGHNIIPMEQLRAHCAALGLKNVKTYVQSGNIVFEAKETAGHWAGAIETMIKKKYGFDVPVLMRTAAEMESIFKSNPFLKGKGIDMARLYVSFLSGVPKKEGLKALASVAAAEDRFESVDREIYLYCRGGYGNTKLSNNLVEKKLGLSATTRNWNSVGKLCELARVLLAA